MLSWIGYLYTRKNNLGGEWNVRRVRDIAFIILEPREAVAKLFFFFPSLTEVRVHVASCFAVPQLHTKSFKSSEK